MRILLLMMLTVGMRAGEKEPPPSPIEIFLREAEAHALDEQRRLPPGSTYMEGGRYSDLGRDLRAAQVNDIVTIVVTDRASAIARGVTSSSRKSSARGSIDALAGPVKATGPFRDLLGLQSQSDLKGQGETTRETLLTTTLSARVTHVLPNGNLVVEGSKEIAVNSERQLVTLRGVLRWNDLTPGNQIRSDRLAFLEVQINGRGVVGDAIRRPFILYRILMGLLPF